MKPKTPRSKSTQIRSGTPRPKSTRRWRELTRLIDGQSDWNVVTTVVVSAATHLRSRSRSQGEKSAQNQTPARQHGQIVEQVETRMPQAQVEQSQLAIHTQKSQVEAPIQHHQFETPNSHQSPVAHYQMSTSTPMPTSQVETHLPKSQVKTPVPKSQGETPALKYQLRSQLESPVLKSQLETPTLRSQLESPVMKSQLETPVLRSQLETPVLQSQLETPVLNSETHVSQHWLHTSKPQYLLVTPAPASQVEVDIQQHHSHTTMLDTKMSRSQFETRLQLFVTPTQGQIKASSCSESRTVGHMNKSNDTNSLPDGACFSKGTRQHDEGHTPTQDSGFQRSFNEFVEAGTSSALPVEDDKASEVTGVFGVNCQLNYTNRFTNIAIHQTKPQDIEKRKQPCRKSQKTTLPRRARGSTRASSASKKLVEASTKQASTIVRRRHVGKSSTTVHRRPKTYGLREHVSKAILFQIKHSQSKGTTDKPVASNIVKREMLVPVVLPRKKTKTKIESLASSSKTRNFEANKDDNAKEFMSSCKKKARSETKNDDPEALASPLNTGNAEVVAEKDGAELFVSARKKRKARLETKSDERETLTLPPKTGNAEDGAELFVFSRKKGKAQLETKSDERETSTLPPKTGNAEDGAELFVSSRKKRKARLETKSDERETSTLPPKTGNAEDGAELFVSSRKKRKARLETKSDERETLTSPPKTGNAEDGAELFVSSCKKRKARLETKSDERETLTLPPKTGNAEDGAELFVSSRKKRKARLETKSDERETSTLPPKTGNAEVVAEKDDGAKLFVSPHRKRKVKPTTQLGGCDTLTLPCKTGNAELVAEKDDEAELSVYPLKKRKARPETKPGGCCTLASPRKTGNTGKAAHEPSVKPRKKRDGPGTSRDEDEEPTVWSQKKAKKRSRAKRDDEQLVSPCRTKARRENKEDQNESSVSPRKQKESLKTKVDVRQPRMSSQRKGTSKKNKKAAKKEVEPKLSMLSRKKRKRLETVGDDHMLLKSPRKTGTAWTGATEDSPPSMLSPESKARITKSKKKYMLVSLSFKEPDKGKKTNNTADQEARQGDQQEQLLTQNTYEEDLVLTCDTVAEGSLVVRDGDEQEWMVTLNDDEGQQMMLSPNADEKEQLVANEQEPNANEEKQLLAPNADKQEPLVAPNVNEDEPLVDPNVNEQEPLVTPDVDEEELLVAPNGDEQEPLVDPNGDEQESLVTPSVDEEELLVAPNVDEQEPLVTPNVDEQESLVTPNVDEQEPLVTPNVNEQEPLVTPNVDEDEPLVAPNGDEQEPVVTPNVDEQESLVTPNVDEQEPLVAPNGDEQESLVTPNVDEEEPLVAPNVNEQESLVTPNVDEQESLVTPNVDKQEPLVAPNVDEQESLVTPNIDEQESLVTPNVDEQESLMTPNLDEEEPLVTPNAVDEQESLVTPNVDEDELLVAPNVDEQEPLVTPNVDEDELLVAPNVDEQEPLVTPNVNEDELLVAPKVNENELLVTPNVDEQEPLAAPNVDEQGPLVTPDADTSGPLMTCDPEELMVILNNIEQGLPMTHRPTCDSPGPVMLRCIDEQGPTSDDGEVRYVAMRDEVVKPASENQRATGTEQEPLATPKTVKKGKYKKRESGLPNQRQSLYGLRENAPKVKLFQIKPKEKGKKRDINNNEDAEIEPALPAGKKQEGRPVVAEHAKSSAHKMASSVNEPAGRGVKRQRGRPRMTADHVKTTAVSEAVSQAVMPSSKERQPEASKKKKKQKGCPKSADHVKAFSVSTDVPESMEPSTNVQDEVQEKQTSTAPLKRKLFTSSLTNQRRGSYGLRETVPKTDLFQIKPPELKKKKAKAETSGEDGHDVSVATADAADSARPPVASTSVPKLMEPTTDEQEPLLGKLVWARFGGYRWWPGIIVRGNMCCLRAAKYGNSWVYWFGDHKVSEVSHEKIRPFTSDFCNYVKKSTTMAKTFHKAVIEAVQACSERASFSPGKTEEDLLPWAENGFKVQNEKSLQGQLDEAKGNQQLPDCVIEGVAALSAKIRRNKEDKKEEKRAADSEWKPTRLEILEQRKKSAHEDAVVDIRSGRRAITDTCLACTGTSTSAVVVVQHPFFEGGLCETCKEELMDTMFAFGADGTGVFCIICGNGGDLFVCDKTACNRVYCTGCIVALVAPTAIDLIHRTDPWLCFMCSEHKPETHGLLVKKANWQQNVHGLFNHIIGSLPPTPEDLPTQRMRVLSLFDGIGTGKYVLDQLDFDVEVYYASEIDQDAINVTKMQHKDNVTHLGDVRTIAVQKLKEIGPIDLLIGGSPCNELSLCNPARKGLGDGTGLLFFEFYRILNTLQKSNKGRHVFWLFENVVSMPKEVKSSISRFFGCEPAKLNSKYFSAQQRARYFWGNLPGIYCPPQLDHFTEKGANLNKVLTPFCNRVARFEKIQTVTTKSNSFRQGHKDSRGELPVMMDGKEDGLWMPEVERLFGFPSHYTDIGYLGPSKRQKLIGKSWSIGVIRHLFTPLKQFFVLKENGEREQIDPNL